MKMRSVMGVFCIMSLVPLAAFARERITAAVAANFIEPFGVIARAFEKGTRIQVEPVFSSTGKLYAQISEGAPFDVFLSADRKRPDELFRKGLSGKPFVYANGSVVLWTARKDLCGAGDWRAVIARPDVKRISIANTETAPYGAASMAALQAAGLREKFRAKLVFPQDIALSFQYAFTGSVDAGFCALSSVRSTQGSRGCYLAVNESPPVVQAACVLNGTRRKTAAAKFAAFLVSPEAKAVNKRYGYR